VSRGRYGRSTGAGGGIEEPSVLVRTALFVTLVTEADRPAGRMSRKRRTNCEYRDISNKAMAEIARFLLMVMVRGKDV
jgi:hypothetical protein